ncbi:hypothetical protein EBN03_27690 [Nocardia stercoris]|uniref:Uncharacterized protein n=1 Tax=Nocardia stercoris TaxID=2483361 RepID=A0A3M2L334_9NOCA|nr:hypothetical protein EBN03_27690 [Nocardia stercoris]
MSEDPETAQALMFLAELGHHAERLVLRRSQWRDDKPNQAVEAELAQVHNLRLRFPGLEQTSRRFPAMRRDSDQAG